MNEQLPTISTKPRNAFMACFLSLVLSGLGQVYNGQLKKAIVLIGLLLFIPILFGITRGTTCFGGFLLLYAIKWILKIYAVIDAWINAKRQKDYVLKSYNTWYYYLVIALIAFVVFGLYNSPAVLGTQSFKVPSISGNPTIQLEDRIIADMKAYKNKTPDYGDIVVFLGVNGQKYTFRVVGLPNDNVEINDNIVTINNKPSKTTFIKETTDENRLVSELEEELPNGHKHLIFLLKQPDNGTIRNIEDIVVPADSYFLLGDNRDNAFDSRYQGFINKERIKGRVLYSYMGQTIDRINIDFRNK
ncbi:MAG: signal peptidase I [Candidatus Symbiothrix sp.]|jgi:signal peptidase I|nr:signal peptidase I [Candidatus Symbiothrix sp.]